MTYKIFKVPTRDPEAALAEMDSFCASHAIESIQSGLVADGGNSFWSFCIKVVDSRKGASITVSSSKSYKAKIDYQSYFKDPNDFTLFAMLRDWRNARSKEEKLPAYTILNNAQIAEIVEQKVSTLTELKALSGIGELKIEKYGQDILNTITLTHQRTGADRQTGQT